MREYQVRICERLGVQFPGPTRQTLPLDLSTANGRNRRVSPVAPRPREGPLNEPKAGAQPWPRERVLMPLKRPCRRDRGTARSGGSLSLAPGVSTVRYPIPERIFDYVSTVRSATAGACRFRTFTATRL
jgi:hypothetical protein